MDTPYGKTYITLTVAVNSKSGTDGVIDDKHVHKNMNMDYGS